MTSCLLVKSKKRLVCVSDGMLSRSSGKGDVATFLDTSKIIEFPVYYRYPQFNLGRFDRYKKYNSNPWFVAYAGDHIVSTEILAEFKKRLDRLYLTRDDDTREAVLSNSFDESGGFFEDYYFRPEEMPRISARDIVCELRAAFEHKGGAFSCSRSERPNTQYFLFGVDETTGDYAAYVMSVEAEGYYPSRPLVVRTERIMDGVLTAIGSPVTAGDAHNDEELRKGLDGWERDVDPFYADFLFEDYPLPSTIWDTQKVAERFCRIIETTADTSVGGNMIVAEGLWGRDRITLEEVVPPEEPEL